MAGSISLTTEQLLLGALTILGWGATAVATSWRFSQHVADVTAWRKSIDQELYGDEKRHEPGLLVRVKALESPEEEAHSRPRR